MKDGPRKTACCVVCDEPVYEIRAFDPETQNPVKLGPPHTSARQVAFRLVGGSLVHISVCGDCVGRVESDWNLLVRAIWKRIVLATVYLRDNPRLGIDREDWIRNHNKAIVRLLADPPIAFLGLRRMPE